MIELMIMISCVGRVFFVFFKKEKKRKELSGLKNSLEEEYFILFYFKSKFYSSRVHGSSLS